MKIKNCKKCYYYRHCMRRKDGEETADGDVCGIYEERSIGDHFRELNNDKIASFLWQVQTGLRRSLSEKSWLDWLNETYEED